MAVTAPRVRTRKISFEEFLETWPDDIHAEWLWQDPLPSVAMPIHECGCLS